MEEIWDCPYNRFCADCNQPNPQRINMDLQVTICSECAILHTQLSDGTYHVIDVTSEENNDDLEFSNFTGNYKSNQYYEHSIPAYIHKPDNNSPHTLKEQWIFAKYDRKEFAQDTLPRIWYHDFDSKVGWLWKRGKNKSGDLFRKRYFVLDRSRESFSYYLQANDPEPKLTSHVDNVSVYLNPENIDERHSMQIVIKKDKNRRSIFTYSDISEDIYNWYMAIRSVKWSIFRYLNHYMEKEILYKMVPHGYLKQGWLYKSGRKSIDRVLQRWFCLENDSLVYSDHPLNPYPKGEINFLCEELRHIKVSFENEVSIASKTFCFSLKMPDRTYYLASADENQRKDWIEKIRLAIDHLKEEIVQRF